MTSTAATSIRTIVVGIEPAESSATQLAWAERLAVGCGARLVLVSAFGRHLQRLPESDFLKLKERHRALLERMVESLTNRNISATFELINDDPRKGLRDAIRSSGADLLVVGVSHRSAGPGFLHIGSVTEYLAHHVDCALAVIRDDDGNFPPRVLLGVDGSANGLAAAAWTGAFAAATKASVRAIAVEEPSVTASLEFNESDWVRGVERIVETVWAAPAAEAASDFAAEAHRGNRPAAVLIEEAAKWPATAVVVGTRGTGGFLGLRAGGVALKVLHGSERTVVLVPPEPNAPDSVSPGVTSP